MSVYEGLPEGFEAESWEEMIRDLGICLSCDADVLLTDKAAGREPVRSWYAVTPNGGFVQVLHG